MKNKKKRKQTFEEFIRRTIVEIREKANFKDYRVNFGFVKKEKHDHEKTDYKTAAEIEVDTRYLTASILIYPCLKEKYNRGDYEGVRSVICHEMAHIRTQRIFNVAVDRFVSESELKDAWESLTEEYGRLIHEKMSN